MNNFRSATQQFDELIRQLVQVLKNDSADVNQAPLVALCVSGGADSCFLLRAMAAAREHMAMNLHILHVNHGLRPSSQEDADWVHNLAVTMDVPFQSHRLARTSLNSASQANLQSELRKRRYQWLSTRALSLAGPSRIPVLATGHHAGDQVETILMNLVRGTHLHGLRGIQAWQTLSAPLFTNETALDHLLRIHLFRPLLAWDRPNIEIQLRRLGQQWREDPSNQDLSFTRNLVRHQLIPVLQNLNGRFVPNLARQSKEWTTEIEGLFALYCEVLKGLDPRLPSERFPLPGTILLDQSNYRELPDWQQKGVLHAALRHVQPDGQGVTTQRLDSLNSDLGRITQTGGPWPWFGQISWSYWNREPQMEMGLQPAKRIISLHREGANPFPLDLPFLGIGVRIVVSEPNKRSPDCCLPAAHPSHKWVLHITELHEGSNSALLAQVQTWSTKVPLEMWRNAGRVTLAAPSPSSYMQPIGMRGHHKSLRHILRDRKIHRALHGLWPTLYDEKGTPIWLCGLHLDQRYAIQPQTCEVMWLCWKKEPVTSQEKEYGNP